MNDDRLDRLFPRLEDARISRPVLRLLSRLRRYGVKPAESDGPQWSSACPVCDQISPFGYERGPRHLSVGIQAGTGHAFVRCHRRPCCDPDEILDAIGLELADLFNDPDAIEAWRNRRGPLPVKRMQLEAWLLLEMPRGRGALSGELAQTVVMEELEAYGIDVSEQYVRSVYRELGGTTRRHYDRLRGASWVWGVLESGFPHTSATSAEGKGFPETGKGNRSRKVPGRRIRPPRRRRERVSPSAEGKGFPTEPREASVHASSAEGKQSPTTLRRTSTASLGREEPVDHETLQGERSEPDKPGERSERHAGTTNDDGGRHVPGGAFAITVIADVVPIGRTASARTARNDCPECGGLGAPHPPGRHRLTCSRHDLHKTRTA